MNGEQLHAALQICIDALEMGVDTERCLELFPDLRAELRPALEGAVGARSVAQAEIPRGIQDRSRARLLGQAQRMGRHRRPRWFGLPKFALASFGAILFFFMGAGGLFAASANSLPGDALYPVKRSVEALSLSIAPSNSLKRSLQSSYEKRRVSEAERLLRLGRSERVTFEGIVRAMNGDELLVDDFLVRIPLTLALPPQLSVGEGVEVSGQVQPDGWIRADGLTLKAFQLQGRVERIVGDEWRIDGQRLKVTALTLIQPGIQMGDRVIALVRVEDEWVAQAILRFDTPPAGDSEDRQTPQDGEPKEERESEPAEEQDRELTGRLEIVEGNVWIVESRSITVTEGTEIDAGIATGDVIWVRVIITADGEWLAQKVELREKAPGPESEEAGEPENGPSDSTGEGESEEHSGGGEGEGDEASEDGEPEDAPDLD
jgi:hypothetical protein